MIMEFYVFFKSGWNLGLKISKSKLIENHGSNKCQYCFANISPTKAPIIMKFCVVVNYYLVSLSLKFHEDPCINVRTPVVNARAHVLSRVRAFTTPMDQTNVSIVLQISRQRKLGSSWNFMWWSIIILSAKVSNNMEIARSSRKCAHSR